MANRTFLERKIDQACKKSRISKTGKKLIIIYIQEIINQIIKECEKRIIVDDKTRCVIPLLTINIVCEEIIKSLNQSLPVDLNNPQEANKKVRNSYDIDIPDYPEVA